MKFRKRTSILVQRSLDRNQLLNNYIERQTFGAIKTLLPICSIRRGLGPDTLAEHYCQNFRNRKKWLDARTPAEEFISKGEVFCVTAPEQNDTGRRRRNVTLWPTSELITGRTTPSMSVHQPTTGQLVVRQPLPIHQTEEGLGIGSATQFPSSSFNPLS